MSRDTMNPIPQQRDSRRSAFCPACDLLGESVDQPAHSPNGDLAARNANNRHYETGRDRTQAMLDLLGQIAAARFAHRRRGGLTQDQNGEAEQDPSTVAWTPDWWTSLQVSRAESGVSSSIDVRFGRSTIGLLNRRQPTGATPAGDCAVNRAPRLAHRGFAVQLRSTGGHPSVVSRIVAVAQSALGPRSNTLAACSSYSSRPVRFRPRPSWSG